jgi:hypothetical protein
MREMRRPERSGAEHGVERERNAERQRSERRERASHQQPQSEERRRNSERERTISRERTDRELNRSSQRTIESGRPAAERNGRGDRANFAEARGRLSEEQRERLHRAFDFEHARVAHADFDWHVGHRVPRHVRLYPVPADVISFLPYYRDYSYFVVDTEICIVDPRTYEVVDVIDEGYLGRPRSRVAVLALSPRQIAALRDSIPPDLPVAGLRLRLALGAEIPDNVVLHEFPPIVLDRAPDLQNYRFLVTEDQVVIVDPRDRSIALVLDR